jgi:phage terminase large subunit-like protein
MEQDEAALWRRTDLEQFRVAEAPPLAKISVGVDPSGGAGEQGIVVVGKHVMNVLTDKGPQRKFEGYVLDDRTCHLGPAGWGRRAVQAAIDWEADDIVVETNFGGQMAVVTIRDAAEALGVVIPVKEVVASRGKRVRAEPVAALSARGQWHHVGVFDVLEDQLCTWTEDLGYSPDRLDAMVWPPWHQRIVSTRPRGIASFPVGGSMTRSIG